MALSIYTHLWTIEHQCELFLVMSAVHIAKCKLMSLNASKLLFWMITCNLPRQQENIIAQLGGCSVIDHKDVHSSL